MAYDPSSAETRISACAFNPQAHGCYFLTESCFGHMFDERAARYPDYETMER